MLALSSPFVHAYAPVAPLALTTAQRAAAPVMETIDDLKAMAPKLNPVVGYWNPLSLGETSIGSSYDAEAAIGFLRHAEIKHGRVAAAAGPPAQWDAVPTAGKLQILLVIAALEMW